jgi:spermidine synthase
MEVNCKNFKIETAYNRINACYRRDRLELRSDNDALQSVINLQNPHRLELENLEYLMAVLMFIPQPKRLLMLGTAAGSLLHFLRHHYPEAEITAVDIDVELIEQLLEMGILPPAQAGGLSYVYADAAHFIEHCQQNYDLVLLDIFSGAQSPPWLLKKNVTNNLFRLLSERGALAYNLIIDSEHDFKRFYRDLGLVFDEQTLWLPVQGLENTIAYGFRSPRPALDMTQNMQLAITLSERLEIDLMRVLAVIYSTNPVGRGVI